MEQGGAGSSNNVHAYEGDGPSNPPPPPPPMLFMGEVSERIHQLQMELADCNLYLGRVTEKYDWLLLQEAHSAREIAQMRTYLGNQCQSY